MSYAAMHDSCCKRRQVPSSSSRSLTTIEPPLRTTPSRLLTPPLLVPLRTTLSLSLLCLHFSLRWPGRNASIPPHPHWPACAEGKKCFRHPYHLALSRTDRMRFGPTFHPAVQPPRMIWKWARNPGSGQMSAMLGSRELPFPACIAGCRVRLANGPIPHARMSCWTMTGSRRQ